MAGGRPQKIVTIINAIASLGWGVSSAPSGHGSILLYRSYAMFFLNILFSSSAYTTNYIYYYSYTIERS
jgi:hypothetical protein